MELSFLGLGEQMLFDRFGRGSVLRGFGDFKGSKGVFGFGSRQEDSEASVGSEFCGAKEGLGNVAVSGRVHGGGENFSAGAVPVDGRVCKGGKAVVAFVVGVEAPFQKKLELALSAKGGCQSKKRPARRGFHKGVAAALDERFESFARASCFDGFPEIGVGLVHGAILHVAAGSR